jgi:hypothetical protein
MGWTACYFLQKSSFIQKCINLDKPEMHCEGQCALREKLTKSDANDFSNLPNYLREIGQELFYFQSILVLTEPKNLDLFSQKSQPNYWLKLVGASHLAIDKPPCWG